MATAAKMMSTIIDMLYLFTTLSLLLGSIAQTYSPGHPFSKFLALQFRFIGDTKLFHRSTFLYTTYITISYT